MSQRTTSQPDPENIQAALTLLIDVRDAVEGLAAGPEAMPVQSVLSDITLAVRLLRDGMADE